MFDEQAGSSATAASSSNAAGGNNGINPSSNSSSNTASNRHASPIKLIDFGSACFEGNTMYSYIQSRYVSIDKWSYMLGLIQHTVHRPTNASVSRSSETLRLF